jgi:L-malate glycosyltransferase
MKILHLAATPYWSGPLENIARLALAQRAQGHDVAIAIDRKRQEAPSEEPAAPRLQSWDLLAEEGLELSVKSTPLQMLRDVRRLSKVTADVVHSHLSHDHFLARWGRPRRSAVVRSIHAPRSIRKSLPRADAYTVPFQAALDELSRGPAAVLPALLGEEYRPVTDRSALKRELGLRGEPLIGMVSTFQASRRHTVAFEALRKLRDVRPKCQLVLLGDGKLETELRQAVVDQVIADRVHFAGYQSGESYVKHLQAFDEVWILGLGNDWSARAALQARACGARVVGVREGGLPEWADALCEPTSDEVVRASVSKVRVVRNLPSNQAIAEELAALYERAREKRTDVAA